MGVAFTSEAVLLGSVAYAEADLIVTLFTRSHGKLTAMAKAARKSRKRFGGALSLFVVGEATLRERRGSDVLLLDAFDARRDFSRLAGDVLRLGHASYAGELLRELTAARQPEPALLDLLVELYGLLADLEPSPDLLRAFELRLLDEIGLAPVLDRCINCGATADDALASGAVDGERGGLLCGRCAGQALPLPPVARRRLLDLRARTRLAAVAGLPRLARADELAARRALQALLGVHLHRPLASLEFLRQLGPRP